MKTDDLLLALASGAGKAERHVAARRFAWAMACGIALAAMAMAGLLGVRSDLGDAVFLPMFWGKLGFVASLAAASLVGALRLSRPGGRLGWVPLALLLPLSAMWFLAALDMAAAPQEQRWNLFLGRTWAVCSLLIGLLSTPVFIAAFWAMKGLAPTRPTLAGAAAGLLAGTVGALIYCLHCSEVKAPFLGVWYPLGMLAPAAVGALLGRRLLRW